jgi:predicted glycoside hydrolase/deacetylase ChbG (UPF0249 family)
MVRFCIVNADDFGTSRGVNRGIAEAHEAGIVTSTSLMVNRPASEAAAELAAGMPRLSVGLHCNLTHEGGPPVVDLDDAKAVAAELDRQLDRFRALLGRPPTHLDAHHNVHRRENLTPVFADAADRLGIPLRDHSGVHWFGSFYAAWDGETHPEQVSPASLRTMVAGFPDGVTELCCHVGYVDPDFDSEYHAERELELATLLDPRARQAFDEADVVRISYYDPPSATGAAHAAEATP